jgi:hypothetical protein
MGYEDIQGAIQGPLRALEVALDIGNMGFMYHPRRLDWPSLSALSEQVVSDELQ